VVFFRDPTDLSIQRIEACLQALDLPRGGHNKAR
jgi:hypothetical protein